ncbi:pentatricopeptide repeat (PPR) superfamily protein, partial [Striga asiatica]
MYSKGAHHLGDRACSVSVRFSCRSSSRRQETELPPCRPTWVQNRKIPSPKTSLRFIDHTIGLGRQPEEESTASDGDRASLKHSCPAGRRASELSPAADLRLIEEEEGGA